MSSLQGTERNKPQLGYLFLQLQRNKWSWEGNSGQNKKKLGSPWHQSQTLHDLKPSASTSAHIPKYFLVFFGMGNAHSKHLEKSWSSEGETKLAESRVREALWVTTIYWPSLRLVEGTELKQQNPFGSQEPWLHDTWWAGTGTTIPYRDLCRQDSSRPCSSN